MNEAHEGGCECGNVRYRITNAPIVVNCCHCRDCQRITGSAFAINAMIETDQVEVMKGEAVRSILRREGSGETSAWRCDDCQTLLYADHPKLGDAMRFVRVGTLDKGERLTPDAHFFVRSKHPWVMVPDGVPALRDASRERHGCRARRRRDGADRRGDSAVGRHRSRGLSWRSEEVAIAAVHQPRRLADKAQGAAAEVVGLSSSTRRHACGAEQRGRDLAIARTVLPRVQGAEALDQLKAPLRRGRPHRRRATLMDEPPEREGGLHPRQEVVAQGEQQGKVLGQRI